MNENTLAPEPARPAALPGLRRRASALEARRAACLSDAEAANLRLAAANGRLALKPGVEAFLEALQERLHRKAVGQFERLLTGIMEDVFRSGDRVSIELSSRAGRAEAAFSVSNGGEAEDALNGRGGSVANVLSAGLRFIALGRSRLRRFIVLDEADCWLSPDNVPAFAATVAALSREAGVQVLMVSHHDPAFFEGCATLVRLERAAGGGHREARVGKVSGLPAAWDDTEDGGMRDGIRSIRLRDFMAFADATIPLSPGVTALVGGNDIGKSAVVAALRAALRGEGKEAFIRHGAPSCRLDLDLGPCGVATWERSRKGTRKNRYSLADREGNLVHDSQDARPPEWLEDLGFDTGGDLDFQIGHQKTPVFLLGETGARQASVLSVGREASWLDAMRAKYRDDCRRDATEAKDAAAALEDLRRRWQSLEPAEALCGRLAGLEADEAALLSARLSVERGEALAERIERLSAACAAAATPPPAAPRMEATSALAALAAGLGRLSGVGAMPACPPLPPVPRREETDALGGIVSRIVRAAPLAALEEPPALPPVPVPEDAVAVVRTGRRMQSALKAARIRPPAAPPFPPEVLPLSGLESACRRLAEAGMQEGRLAGEGKSARADLEGLDGEWQRAADAAGGVCPACGGPLSGLRTHAHHKNFKLIQRSDGYEYKTGRADGFTGNLSQ